MIPTFLVPVLSGDRRLLFFLNFSQKMKTASCILGCFLIIMTGSAQVFENPDFRNRASVGMKMVYQLQFEAANSHFLLLKDDFAGHPAPHFLLALNRWWQTYLSPTDDHFHLYIESELSNCLELNKPLKAIPAYELEYVFFQYMSYAFRARLYILQQNYWKAANSGRKALTYLKKGFEFTDQAPEFYFSSGIYHYYAAVYPRNHPIVRPFLIFFPDGDASLGLTELEKAAAVPNFAQVEASFYLTSIYLHHEKDVQQARQVAQGLVSEYPDNIWFQLDLAEVLIAEKTFPQALLILETAQRSFEQHASHDQIPIRSREQSLSTYVMMRVYHLLGQIAFQDSTLIHALDHFRTSNRMAELASIESNAMLPVNYLHIGYCYDRMGMRKAAVAAYQKAIKLPENEAIKSRAKACLQAPCMD